MQLLPTFGISLSADDEQTLLQARCCACIVIGRDEVLAIVQSLDANNSGMVKYNDFIKALL